MTSVMKSMRLARYLLDAAKKSKIVPRQFLGSSFGIHSESGRSTMSEDPHNGHSRSRGKRKYNTLNQDTPYNLVFLRHGQSTWNRDNRFIGWTDTPLTNDGVLEARVAGQMLKRSGALFDEVHT